MQANDAIKQRYSCREFLAKPIPRQLITELIDSARLAPTARNVQPWEFVAISDREKLKKIASLASNGPFVADCGCCIAVFCKETKYYLEDGCAATENILLRATDLGLGSCWVAGDKKPYCDEIKQMVAAAADFKLVALIALGYPKHPQAEGHSKRAVAEVLHWEKFK